MSEVIIIDPKLICIPSGYHKYLDTTYDFNIVECYPSIEIEIDSKGNFLRAPVFNDGKSHKLFSNKVIKIPECIYFKIKKDNGVLNIFIDKSSNQDLFEAAKGFRESKSSNKRVHKYMTLFKAYEALTNKHHRHLDFTAVRHCLSHSTNSLTKQNVLQKLTDLFGQPTIDFSKPKHARVFYMTYWKLLIATDEILFSEVSNKIKTIKGLTTNCAYVK